jgi:uncharacterized protein (DUF305 family)
MCNRQFRRTLPALLVLGLLLALPALAAADPGPHPEFVAQQQSIQELRQLGGSALEIGYINRIVPHHQGAIDMAQVIAQKATHPELRDEAQEMIKEQQDEIAMLTTYLQRTHGQQVQPDRRFMMMPDMMQMLRDADPMMAEKMFLLMMREHHQSANELGAIILGKPASQTLKDQAQMMVTSQTAQQGRFANYLKTWYNITAPTPTGDMMAAMELAMETGGGMPGLPNTGGGGLASDRTAPANATHMAAGALLALFVAGTARRLHR